MMPIALFPIESFALAISSVSLQGFNGIFKVIMGTGFGVVVHKLLVGLSIFSFIVKNIVC